MALLMATISTVLVVELAYARPDAADVFLGLCGAQIGGMFSDSQARPGGGRAGGRNLRPGRSAPRRALIRNASKA